MINKIKDELKKSMKSHNTKKTSILRLILNRLNEEIKVKKEKSNLIGSLDSMIKERLKTIETAKTANRNDIVDNEEYEISVIEEFLPKRMSMDEIKLIVNSVITLTNAKSIKDMGRVIGMTVKKVGDKAKPSDIAEVAKNLLLNI